MRTLSAIAGAGLLVTACGADSGDPGSEANEAKQLVSEVCGQLSLLPCAPADCEGSYQGELDSAIHSGCTSELAAWLACLKDSPHSCDAEELVMGAGCSMDASAYRTCNLEADGCSAGGATDATTQSCGVQCGGVSAHCEGPTGEAVECACTTPGKEGVKFSAPECPPSSTLVIEYCGTTPAGQ